MLLKILWINSPVTEMKPLADPGTKLLSSGSSTWPNSMMLSSSSAVFLHKNSEVTFSMGNPSGFTWIGFWTLSVIPSESPSIWHPLKLSILAWTVTLTSWSSLALMEKLWVWDQGLYWVYLVLTKGDLRSIHCCSHVVMPITRWCYLRAPRYLLLQ